MHHLDMKLFIRKRSADSRLLFFYVYILPVGSSLKGVAYAVYWRLLVKGKILFTIFKEWSSGKCLIY